MENHLQSNLATTRSLEISFCNVFQINGLNEIRHSKTFNLYSLENNQALMGIFDDTENVNLILLSTFVLKSYEGFPS